MASREVQVRTVSRPGTGGLTGTLPVHSATARRAVMLRVVRRPSTVRVPASRACPRRTVMPAPSAHSTWPASSQSWVMASRRASTAGGSKSAVVAAAAGARAATACPVRSSALDGMQAQYEHSPPSSSASTIIAVSPPRAA